MKNTNILTGLIMAALLFVGIFAGALIFPNQVEKEVIVEKPVNVTVEKIVEVPSNVTCEECDIDKLQLAVDDFMEVVDDEEADKNVLKCKFDGHEYDFDEVSISKLYDVHNIFIEDEENYVVDFTAKLKYKEAGENSCKAKYDVTVTYAEDDDPEVGVELFQLA